MQKNKFVLLLQLFACLVLLSSFSLEYFFNVAVCSLCLIQRALWVFLIFITLLTKNKGIILLIILASMLTAFYQLLMQYGFILAICAINMDPYAPVVSCAEKDFLIMGLPLSFYNLVLNLFIFIFTIKKIGNKEEEKRDDNLFDEQNF